MSNQNTLCEILQKPICCWNGMILKPEVDEDTESVWLAIRYNDHGDDFLLVGLIDGTFHRYGYFKGRTCEFVMNDMYEREPVTWKKPDERAVASNTMYFAFRQRFCAQRPGLIGNNYIEAPRKEDSPRLAQIKFDMFLDKVAQMVSGELVLHEHSGFGYNKRSLRRWLEENDIATPENLKKLEEQSFDTRADGFDGVAGKIRWTNQNIWFDNIVSACINGKDIDVEKIPTYIYGTDEWGYDTMVLNLNSYRMSKKYRPEPQEKQGA